MPEYFLDTNVLLQHFLADHAEFSPRATAFIARIESGEVQVRIADTAVFEAVFTLERHYRRPKSQIRDAVLPLLELPGIVLPGKLRFHRVFEYYVDLNISFADAYHATLMEFLDINEIVTFVRHFDRISAIKRHQP